MLKNRTLFLLGVFLTLPGLLIATSVIEPQLSLKEGKTMLQAQAATANLQKPPIDLAAPSQTATATFALG